MRTFSISFCCIETKINEINFGVNLFYLVLVKMQRIHINVKKTQQIIALLLKGRHSSRKVPTENVKTCVFFHNFFRKIQYNFVHKCHGLLEVYLILFSAPLDSIRSYLKSNSVKLQYSFYLK